MRNQTAAPWIPADKRYKGLLDIVQRLPKEQGTYKALWHSNSAQIARGIAVAASERITDAADRTVVSIVAPIIPRFPTQLASILMFRTGFWGMLFTHPFEIASVNMGLDVAPSSEGNKKSGAIAARRYKRHAS
eukprot:TRINITY_DN2768_c0_g1_i1.p1 TRINITY_DN2768_c0_g1~~TRINITY_DN2768_c0_g1_i1.p1  ORF type:complete len:133 (+),score=10.93 TRINITY_DN2768_c0_g1_i1:118-516(+)